MVSAATTMKTRVNESRIESSTSIPLKALAGSAAAEPHSQTHAAAAPASPRSETAPVAQRLPARRVKASTSITTSPATETISSGRSNSKLTSGEIAGITKLRFIVSTLCGLRERASPS
jgi:hypothetical protein